MLFITTHSPYVLNQLIKAAPKELSVMFTHPQKPASRDFSVKQLNDEEIHEAYDNGVDMFFNTIQVSHLQHGWALQELIRSN